MTTSKMTLSEFLSQLGIEDGEDIEISRISTPYTQLELWKDNTMDTQSALDALKSDVDKTAKALAATFCHATDASILEEIAYWKRKLEEDIQAVERSLVPVEQD